MGHPFPLKSLVTQTQKLSVTGAVPHAAAESMHEEVPLPTYAEALEDIVKELMNKDESDEVILFPPPPTYMEAIQFKKDSG